MDKITNLTSRLDFCKQVSKTRWMARCPSHDDGNPSLSITQHDNGRILIHCHAGCGANQILDTLGLNWGDLYPDDSNYTPLVRKREKEHYADMVVAIAESDMKQGKRLSEEDKQTVLAAKLKRLAS